MFYKNWRTYGFTPDGQTNNLGLELVCLSLVPIEDSSVRAERDQYSVLIWSSDSFKKPAKITFRTDQERIAFEKAYDEYYDKRWEDMPQIDMSNENYDQLLQKWQKIRQEKPTYLIFTLDDSGPLDVVDIISKNELSAQDLDDMKREHQGYLRWKKAWSLYHQDHPFQDDLWRSPSDDEYEADIEKYYDRETGFYPQKIYTKKQLGHELKKMVQEQQQPAIIGHWIVVMNCREITDRDEAFDQVFDSLGIMERYPEFAVSYEKLDEIADALIAGKDIAPSELT